MFAFLVAARFAALIVSLPPYQFARDKNARPWATQARLMRLSRMSRNQRPIVHWKWLHKMLRERGLGLWTWRDSNPRPPA